VGDVNNELETLLTVQEHDLALDRLRHRHDSLPERSSLASAEARAAELARRATVVGGERDALAREETRLDDQARSFAEKAKEVEAKMYSGEVSSPRELQAMQADVDQLQRHQRDLENRELELMEQREPLDAEVVSLAAQRTTVTEEIAELRAVLERAEAEIEGEAQAERDARGALTADLDPALHAAYERQRAKPQGVGAARLVGATCQGCHLTIPATEVERIRHAPDGTLAFCDNCGCILVP
jgi:uncharacterized protein